MDERDIVEAAFEEAMADGDYGAAEALANELAAMQETEETEEETQQED